MVRVAFLPESGLFWLISLINLLFLNYMSLSENQYKNSTRWKKVHPNEDGEHLQELVSHTGKTGYGG